MFITKKTIDVSFIRIENYKTINQIDQGEGERKREGEGGHHLPKNSSIGSTNQLGGVEGFPFQGNIRS